MSGYMLARGTLQCGYEIPSIFDSSIGMEEFGTCISQSDPFYVAFLSPINMLLMQEGCKFLL